VAPSPEAWQFWPTPPAILAKRLIARGFLNEVVDRLPQAELCEYLHQQIEARL